jgi:hypothetical protein
VPHIIDRTVANMLARLHVVLPFALTLPDGEVFSVYGYEDEGYEIRIYPPVRSDQPSPDTIADGIYIDEKPAIQANALRIDFRKDDFDRRSGIECDPPYELIRRTINLFLRKVRFVTRGFQVTPINFPQAPWRLRYLNDDGGELETVKGLVKGRGAVAFSFSWIAITAKIWNDIHGLAVNYAPPEWDSLYLDAVATLPDIGPSLVLAATSLEVFISHVLDALATKNVVPPQLWDWINNREWLREPTVEEQFDDLLKLLLGASLKENSTL